MEDHNSNEHVLTLQDSLARITGGIGALLTEHALVQETSEALLTQWGVTPTAATTMHAPEYSPVPDRPAPDWLQPGRQALLNIEIENLPTAQAHDTAVRAIRSGTINALHRNGLLTVRDVLVTGAANIGKIRQLAGRKVEWLRTVIAAYDPALPPLPKNADPALAARLCPTLQDVPLLSIMPELADRTIHPIWYEGTLYPPLTIGDFLDRPPQELFYHYDVDKDATPLEPDNPIYQDIRERAEKFAQEFRAAQDRQKNPQ